MADDNRGQVAGLGCGTFILIALIVLIFSNRGTHEIQGELRKIRTEVRELRSAMDEQTALIKALREKTEEIAKKP